MSSAFCKMSDGTEIFYKDWGSKHGLADRVPSRLAADRR